MSGRRHMLLALGLALAGCPGAADEEPAGHGGRPHDGVEIEEALVVEAAPVTRESLEVVGHHAGELRAERVAEVSVETAGRVLAVPHRMGDRVSTGDVLATLDGQVYQRRVKELAAEISVGRARRDEAKARVGRLSTELERKRPLVAEGAVTAVEIDTLDGELAVAEAAVAVAAAAINETRARLDTAREELAKTTVLAPLAGVIAERHVEVGEHVAPGGPLFRIVDGCDLTLRLGVPEHEAARVSPGTVVRARVSDRALTGAVLRRSPSLDERTRTLAVDVRLEGLTCVEGRAVIPAADGAAAVEVAPGMTATCQIALGFAADALTVPNQALVTAVDGGVSAWVAADGAASRRPVEVGLRGRTRTQITSGLDASELVIVRGQDKLTDGVAVRAMEPPR